MSRNRLKVNKLQEFAEFCASEGWQKQEPKSFYEVLRMKKGKKTLLVYQRLTTNIGTALVHLTLHGESEIMFSKYIKAKAASVETNSEGRQ